MCKLVPGRKHFGRDGSIQMTCKVSRNVAHEPERRDLTLGSQARLYKE